MSKIIINQEDIEKIPGWKDMIIENKNHIEKDILSHFSECKVIIKEFDRDGCDLNIIFEVSCNEQEHNAISIIIANSFFKLCDGLKNFCYKCGKNKGAPPSLSVRNGLCENCRKEIKKSDYNNSKIICVTGKAGSGKDSIADYLVKERNFKRLALADPIRDIIHLLLVMDIENVWDRVLREKPIDFITKSKIDNDYWSVRKLLQFTGTDLFRNLVCKKIWIRNLIQRIEPGRNYVTTDIRFPNEIDGVREKIGGEIFFVNVVRDGYAGDVGFLGHESETHELKSEHIIENNGTLKDLYNQIEKILISKMG